MFKVGDKVRCIDDDNENGKLKSITKGDIYTICKIDEMYLSVKSGSKPSFYHDRFELVVEETTPSPSKKLTREEEWGF